MKKTIIDILVADKNFVAFLDEVDANDVDENTFIETAMCYARKKLRAAGLKPGELELFDGTRDALDILRFT